MICAVHIDFDLNLYTDYLKQLLPVHVIQKAEKFHFNDDRKRCLAGELLKMVTLAQLLETDASRLKFESNSFGKPVLAGHIHHHAHFNLSHSGKWVVIAIDDNPVGIDIEKVQPHIPDVENIVFTKQEINQIYCSPPDQQILRFFKQWTRKESYIKAIGLGFSAKLEDISILETSDGTIRIETYHSDKNWFIRDLEFDPAYSLTVCSKNILSDEIETFDFQTLLERYQ